MKKLFLYLIREGSESTLAGLTPTEWLLENNAKVPHRIVDSLEEVTPVRDSKYLAILYPSTPLMTAEILLDLVKEMGKRGIDGLEIGRGMIVETEAFRRDILPKRKAATPYALEITDAKSANEAERILYRKNAEKCVQNGAIIPDVTSVRIDALSLVEEGATVEPYTTIKRSVVKSGARIGSFSEIEDAEIGESAEISRSVVRESRIGSRATVGPFAYIRMGSVIGAGCRIGDFVEIKKSEIGEGTKAAHLAYIGDASVGASCNVGCGTVFANYDGRTKHRTTVGDNVFLGANTNLIAPVAVGEGAYIAAATTVTEEVPQGAFAIGRNRAIYKQKKRE